MTCSLHTDPIKRGTIIRIENYLKYIDTRRLTRKFGLIYLIVGCASTGQRSAYLTALLVVKSNDHDMQHRSLHLVSALRLHSFPKPMSGQCCTALASVECSHSQRNRVFFSHCEWRVQNSQTRPLLRSLPLRPTTPNVNCV